MKNDRALGNELIAQIEESLPGCNIYVTRLLPAGKIAKCVAASPTSEMFNSRLHRGKGVSFFGIDKGAFLLIDDEHEMVKELHKFHSYKLPYLCIPVFGPSDSVLGYIGIDTFDEVPRSHVREKQPENGIAEWLCQVGKELGSAMSFMEEVRCLQFIKDVVGNNYDASAVDVYGAAFSAINALVLNAESMAVWRMDHKAYTWNVEYSVLHQSDVVKSFLQKNVKFEVAKSHNNKDDLFILKSQDRLGLPKGVVKELGERVKSPRPRSFILKTSPQHIIARFQTPYIKNAADCSFVLAVKYAKDRVGKGDYIRYLGKIATTVDISIQCILQRNARRDQRLKILEETAVKCETYRPQSSHKSVLASLSQVVMKGIPGCNLFRVWSCNGGRLELTYSSYPDQAKSVPVNKLEEDAERTSLRALGENRCIVYKADSKEWFPQDVEHPDVVDLVKQADPENMFKDLLLRQMDDHFVYAPISTLGKRCGLLEVEFESDDVDEFGENYALENGVAEFVKDVGEHFGKVCSKYKEHASKEVARAQKDLMPSDVTSVNQVWKVLFDCVRLAVPLAQHLEIWKLDNDLHLHCVADAAGKSSQPVSVEVPISHGRCVSSIMHCNEESFISLLAGSLMMREHRGFVRYTDRGAAHAVDDADPELTNGDYRNHAYRVDVDTLVAFVARFLDDPK